MAEIAPHKPLVFRRRDTTRGRPLEYDISRAVRAERSAREDWIGELDESEE